MADLWVDELVPCADPECPQEQPSGQPETDGDLRYYACGCGYEFGYQRAAADEGTCAAGIPESVRRAASIAPAQEQQPVFLGTTIGRRPQ